MASRGRPVEGTKEELFKAKVNDSGGPGACWPYPLNTAGRALFTYRVKIKGEDGKEESKRITVHAPRFALELKLGRSLAENEEQANHPTCMTACCNPDHLSVHVRVTPATPRAVNDSEYPGRYEVPNKGMKVYHIFRDELFGYLKRLAYTDETLLSQRVLRYEREYGVNHNFLKFIWYAWGTRDRRAISNGLGSPARIEKLLVQGLDKALGAWRSGLKFDEYVWPQESQEYVPDTQDVIIDDADPHVLFEFNSGRAVYLAHLAEFGGDKEAVAQLYIDQCVQWLTIPDGERKKMYADNYIRRWHVWLMQKVGRMDAIHPKTRVYIDPGIVPWEPGEAGEYFYKRNNDFTQYVADYPSVQEGIDIRKVR